MKLIRTEDAVGHVLCHDLTQIIKDQYKDARFRKGHVVAPEDIPVLLGMGKEHLYVWEMTPGMLHEDEGAERLLALCANENMERSGVKEGKIELKASCDGLFLLRSESLRAVNAIDELMIATRKGGTAVKKGDKLAGLLASGDVFLAMGNSDVPVGQYTQKIFTYYGLNEETLASSGVLTYGSNVKEVTTQVSEGTVDCGVIYATDAFSAGLTVVDEATAEMCGQVIYPAAVMKNSANPDAAKAFLDFLSTDEAMACFEAVGFSPMV